MQLLNRVVRRFGGKRWFVAITSRVAPPADRLVSRVTGGRATLSGAAVPTLLLVHTGRTSGAERRTPLVYVQTDGGWAVVGTNFGRPEHPHWALNLLAEPRAEVVHQGLATPVRARRVTGEEQAGLWPRFVDRYPGYADYAERLEREAHMFLLEPTSR